MVNVAPLLPALVPLATLLWIRAADHSVSISRNSWDHEYDYIVGMFASFFLLHTFSSFSHLFTLATTVGGGSAGAVMASRLSEDPTMRVLLLEAGGSENIFSDIPLAAATLQMTPIDWAYQTEPQEASCFGLINRVCVHRR